MKYPLFVCRGSTLFSFYTYFIMNALNNNYKIEVYDIVENKGRLLLICT